MRAVVQRLRSIISNAVLGGGRTDASATVSAADAVVGRQNEVKGDLKREMKGEFKKELKAIEQDLLRHQISTKWELMHRIERLREPARELTCALCGHTEPAEAFTVFESACIFEGGEITRHQCPKCDVIFGSSLMLSLSAGELTREYEWHYRVFSEGDSTEQELRAFHALNPERDKKYVNWGSGAWSRSVEVLRADGWQVFGFEPHGSAGGEGDAILSSLDELIALKPDGMQGKQHRVRGLQRGCAMVDAGGWVARFLRRID